VLPSGCVARGLEKLKLSRFEDAYPPEGESLRSWIRAAAENAEGKLPLTMILGESRSKYRQPRQPSPQTPSQVRQLTVACTCDGAAGVVALIDRIAARLTSQVEVSGFRCNN
jgi:hypothetical protein